MRNPFRSEAEAFSFVLVCAGLFAVVAVAGVLFGGWVALGVFLVLAVGLAFYIKGVPKEAERPVVAHGGGDRRCILVVANETVAGRALRGEVVRRAEGDADVLVVCPALNSPLRHWASDEDGARALAQDRLEESLGALVGRRGRGPRRGRRRRPHPGDGRRAADVRRRRDRHLDAPARALELAREGDHRARAGALRRAHHARRRRSRGGAHHRWRRRKLRVIDRVPMARVRARVRGRRASEAKLSPPEASSGSRSLRA